jgi:hypothetical protein
MVMGMGMDTAMVVMVTDMVTDIKARRMVTGITRNHKYFKKIIDFIYRSLNPFPS